MSETSNSTSLRASRRSVVMGAAAVALQRFAGDPAPVIVTVAGGSVSEGDCRTVVHSG